MIWMSISSFANLSIIKTVMLESMSSIYFLCSVGKLNRTFALKCSLMMIFEYPEDVCFLVLSN